MNCVSSYEKYALQCLIKRPKNKDLDSWKYEFIDAVRNNLVLADTSNILIKTLKMWFKNHCDSTKTASNLHIHRNTLRYRLNKIMEKTGLNIHSYEEKIILYLALCLIE
jgi:carbohydrate diacid regulator